MENVPDMYVHIHYLNFQHAIADTNCTGNRTVHAYIFTETFSLQSSCACECHAMPKIRQRLRALFLFQKEKRNAFLSPPIQPLPYVFNTTSNK